MTTLYATAKKTNHGYIGYYGLRGTWSKSCGIVRLTKADALHDAKQEVSDLRIMASYQRTGYDGRPTGIDILKTGKAA